jgi:hypothetical protein
VTTLAGCSGEPAGGRVRARADMLRNRPLADVVGTEWPARGERAVADVKEGGGRRAWTASGVEPRDRPGGPGARRHGAVPQLAAGDPRRQALPDVPGPAPPLPGPGPGWGCLGWSRCQAVRKPVAFGPGSRYLPWSGRFLGPGPGLGCLRWSGGVCRPQVGFGVFRWWRARRSGRLGGFSAVRGSCGTGLGGG